ncbi:uncharacterized protein N7483_001351 [Penicillium malachiteum]|uniref:uncharacterized protein n=1 Tax=Penicillium malachiteum TaxID=1324776 RepID=UPI0025475334|nr:uncharacterized protein N7483_001351 [Penicillium malachiteum]KAJ5736226.1 hypothetical protein N7483_001351 [Penicillium malachiteum]
MPSFYAPGHGLPPTPPHVNNGGRLDEQSFYPVAHSAFPPRFHQSGCEFIEQYSQSLCYAKPNSMNLHPQSANMMHPTRESIHAMAQQPMYGQMATLPPLRSSVQLPPMDSAIPPQYRRQDIAPMQQQEQPRKEEKATGGVAAHLDYEMERMSDFVAEMTQGMYDLYNTKIHLADIDFARSVSPGTSAPPSVPEIRLPDLVLDSPAKLFHLAWPVLPGLPHAPAFGSAGVSGQQCKFLDDNTFQNKSWAEVSNIPVAELNKMELEWLFAFEWKIHNRMYDEQDGFNSWRRHWDNWRAKANLRAQETRQALAPLDTNVVRPQQSIAKPLMSPEGPIPPQYQRIENSWLNPAASEYSPPSAPHSGPNTPDYYSAGTWAYPNPPPPYSRAWIPPPSYLPASAPRSQPPSYHHTPAYGLPLCPECMDWPRIFLQLHVLCQTYRALHVQHCLSVPSANSCLNRLIFDSSY